MDEDMAVDTMLESIRLSWQKLADPNITPEEVSIERADLKRFFGMLRDALGLDDS